MCCVEVVEGGGVEEGAESPGKPYDVESRPYMGTGGGPRMGGGNPTLAVMVQQLQVRDRYKVPVL